MFGFPILEVAIGLSFIYLLLSLICTTVNETIATLTRRRSKVLEKAITNIIGDPKLKNELYSHPVIKSLSEGRKPPSYIPAPKFAVALMDIITGEGKAANDPAALKQGLAKRAEEAASKPENAHLSKALSAVLADSREHLKTDQQKIQDWYDESMDRVSGWYKRRTTAWIWGLAFIITLCMNADTIRITRILWSNQAVRSAVVDAAKARAQGAPPEPMPLVEYSDPQNPEESKPVGLPADTLTSQERALLGQLMLGWKEDLAELDQIKQAELNKKSQGQEGALWWASLREWWAPHFLGWLFTMVALSLGAPFWFDTLNKFMNIRNGGKAPAATQQPPATAGTQAVAKGAGA